MEIEEQKYKCRTAKIYFASLKSDNIEEFFQEKYNKWLYYNSFKVTIDKDIEAGWQRFYNILPENRKGEVLNRTVEISNFTKDGFSLTMDIFVDEEIKKYEELYADLESNSKYRELRLKIGTYNDHLKIIKEIGYKNDILCITKTLTLEKLEKLFDLLQDKQFIDYKTDKDFFNYAFGGVPIPIIGKRFKLIIWLKNKQLLRELLFGCKEQSTSGIVGSKENQSKIKKIIPSLFCSPKEKNLKLAKPKYKPDRDSDIIKDILATL